MKKLLIKTSMNANQFAKKYEVNNLPSMTIPDQTMSVKTILERYTRGLPINGFEPIYDEDDVLPDPRTLDLAERQELASSFKNEIQEIESRKKSYTKIEKESKLDSKTDEVES